MLPKQPFKHPPNIVPRTTLKLSSLRYLYITTSYQTNLISIVTKSIKFIPLRYLFEPHIIIIYIFLVPQRLFQTFAWQTLAFTHLNNTTMPILVELILLALYTWMTNQIDANINHANIISLQCLGRPIKFN